MGTAVVARVAGWALALVAGAVFGTAGTITHPFTVGGWLPAGLIVAAVACLALLLAIRLLVDDRGAVISAGLGMLAALALFSGRGPGGSVVVPQAAAGEFPVGMVWMFLLAGIVLIVVAWPDARRLRALRAPSE
ncbi:histidinol dehydrogenase [Microbacterium sp. gxy059]|uniref:histidinol dehydrogenase n=1 Tax=Microbacterium sp. gxy059 TaxID=2957199 RepID=UPI003D961D0E